MSETVEALASKLEKLYFKLKDEVTIGHYETERDGPDVNILIKENKFKRKDR